MTFEKLARIANPGEVLELLENWRGASLAHAAGSVVRPVMAQNVDRRCLLSCRRLGDERTYSRHCENDVPDPLADLAVQNFLEGTWVLS